MEALIRLRFDAAEVQGVGLRRIEPRLAASAGVVVLTNEDIVLQQHDRGTGRRRGLRRAGHVRLVVRMIVECHVIDLDRSIVSGWVLGEGWRRQAGERHASGDGCRPAGPACESSNMHEFPREDPLSKATCLALEAAATYQPCGRSPQGRFRRGWTSACNRYEPLTGGLPAWGRYLSVIYRRGGARRPVIDPGRSSRGQRRQGVVLRIYFEPIPDSDAPV